MRSINLTTFILAPVLVGQIITYASKIAGAAFIAGWNICSGGVEYYLLIRIYRQFPELSQKDMTEVSNGGKTSNKTSYEESGDDTSAISESYVVTDSQSRLGSSSNKHYGAVDKTTNGKSDAGLCSYLAKIFSGIQLRGNESWTGWGDYWVHSVRNAGLGLAMLYMTVLGFDNVTNCKQLSKEI
jgi:iron-regulated transporter 1